MMSEMEAKMRAARMAIYEADRRETCAGTASHGPIIGLDAMLPPAADDACWTTLIGAVPHRLGGMPDECYTCAAKRRENFQRLAQEMSAVVIATEGESTPADVVLIGDDGRDFWRLAPRGGS